MRLVGKVAIVTGASSGLGRTIAQVFARQGASIVVCDIDDADGERTVADIKVSQGKAIFVHADVSLPFEVQDLIKASITAFGRIDIIVNNAGIGQVPTSIEDQDDSLWDKIQAVNVRSVLLTTKYAVPEMKRIGGGGIINIGAMSAVRSRPGHHAYTSSKAAVIALTKSLALELATHNIRVNCINPVATDTPMLRAHVNEESLRAVIRTIPMGRLAQPEDTAFAALYLACDESSMVTGQIINVDGGRAI